MFSEKYGNSTSHYILYDIRAIYKHNRMYIGRYTLASPVLKVSDLYEKLKA